MVNGLTTHTYYKDLQTGKFNLLKKKLTGQIHLILSASMKILKIKDEAYVVTNLDSDKAKIVLYD